MHSLVNFRGFIRPLLDALEPSSMCEIGIEGGMATEFLLGYCRERVCRYVGIDPSAPDEARRRIEEAGQRFDARPSLEALRALPPCDVYFLDGDHNYYTVSNELRLILEAAETARRRPCVFIHDIGWPWGRRDLYYDPSRIPPEERHPYDYELGVRLGNPGLAPGGFRGLGRYACATREGGPRNGVLTAVEDVMKERPSLLRLISVPAVFGLGVLYAPESLDSRQRAVFDAFDETLESSGDLLRNLEHNRLSLYLRVLYLQDEVAPAMKSHIDAREAALRQLESARASLQKRGEELEAELQRLAQEIQSTQEEIARDQAQIAADAVRMQILRLEIWRQAAAGAQTAAELRAVKTSEAYRATWPLRFALDQLRRARAAAARSIREGRARCAKAGVAVIQNLAALLDVAAPYDIISLDIFDTLLRRDIEPPDSLKLRTAKYASMILGQRGFPVDYVLFQSVRDAAERELRVEAANRGRDFECGFEDIMRRTLERLVGAKVAAEESARLMDYELEIEARRLHVAPDAPSVLRELKRRGKRIVAVSDMYLQESHVRRLLGALGIGEWFDAIYMSSDHGAGKHSGRLFQTMLKAEGAAPAKVLHVGDNPVSDGVRPREAGLGAAWLRDPREMRRRGELHRLASQAVEGGEIAPLVSAMTGRPAFQPRRMAFLPTPTERALYDIGFSRIGPSFCAFVLHVLESCARLSIEDIYFVAREGHLFQRLFNLFQPRIRRLRETPPFRQHYIYLSRLSTSLPSVDTFGSRETLLGLWRAQPEGLDSILRAFSLNPEDFASLAASVGIADMRANAADPFTDPSYKAFFEHPEFQSRAGALRDEVRANLRDYLSSEQFFGARERKVFVDIGWNGTIQANLTRAFGADPDFPGLEGFFYGRHYSGYHDYYWNPKSLYHSGFAYDQLRPNADEEAVNHFIHLFELAAGAPHGATLGYRREPDGAVRPILRDHSQPPEVRRIQEGILDYAAEFADTYDLHEVDPAALQRNAARTLARFLLRPTMAEAKAIRSLVHDADWGSEKRFPLVVDGLGPLAWLRPERLRAALDGSIWKEGTLRLTGIPGVFEVVRAYRKSRAVARVVFR